MKESVRVLCTPHRPSTFPLADMAPLCSCAQRCIAVAQHGCSTALFCMLLIWHVLPELHRPKGTQDESVGRRERDEHGCSDVPCAEFAPFIHCLQLMYM